MCLSQSTLPQPAPLWAWSVSGAWCGERGCALECSGEGTQQEVWSVAAGAAAAVAALAHVNIAGDVCAGDGDREGEGARAAGGVCAAGCREGSVDRCCM